MEKYKVPTHEEDKVRMLLDNMNYPNSGLKQKLTFIAPSTPKHLSQHQLILQHKYLVSSQKHILPQADSEDEEEVKRSVIWKGAEDLAAREEEEVVTIEEAVDEDKVAQSPKTE